MMQTGLGYPAIEQTAGFVQKHTTLRPTVAVILGSGLGHLTDWLTDVVTIPYSTIPHFVPSTVPGHRGELVIGRLGSRAITVMNGRLHFYEGYTLEQVTFPVRVLKSIGCHTLIVTNAAGGLNPAFKVGDLMLIRDHINIPGLAGSSPLFGPNDERLGPRFPDMHNAYDAELRAIARRVAQEQNLTLQEGVYVMLGGPSFETPAEVAFLRLMGGDAVGMSTAAEVVVARHGGQRVLGISMISNILTPAPQAPEVSHEEVLAAGTEATTRLAPLLVGIIAHIP